MKPTPKPSEFKTGREYRWAKKAQAKEATAPIRAVIWLFALILIPAWFVSGSFAVGALIAVGVLLALVLIGRARTRSRTP